LGVCKVIREIPLNRAATALLIISAILLSNLLVYPAWASPDTATIVYQSFVQPTISVVDGYHRVEMDRLPSFGDIGEPVLPMKEIKLLVPPMHEVVSIKVIPGEKVDLPGSYYVEPGQEEVPLGYYGYYAPTWPDPDVYQSADAYPGMLLGDQLSQKIRGYDVTVVTLYPVEYVPGEGKLSYYKDMTVEMCLALKTGANANTSRLGSRAKMRRLGSDRTKIARTVSNPDDLAKYNLEIEATLDAEEAGEDVSLSDGEEGEGIEDTSTALGIDGAPTVVDPAESFQYVIITSDALKNAGGAYTFQDLIASKQAKGLTATIVTTEWIYSNYSGARPSGGSDNQTQIRNFIIDAYNNWETEYVLLGGDADSSDVGGESGDNIVPVRELYDSGKLLASDLYYCCLDGNFDNDADGTYGESTDGAGGGEIDLLAEIYIGRAPVDSEQELSNFVMKTLAYDGGSGSYLPKARMVGEYLGFGGVAEYAKNSMEEIRLGSSVAGFTTKGFSENSFFDVSTLYEADQSWSSGTLASIINGGVHILNHLGHCNVNYAMKMGNSTVDALINTKYFFGYSQGCYPASFDNKSVSGYTTSYDCIGEHMVVNSTGAFAFIGNTRYGWGAYYTTAGSSQYFNRQFWDAVFSEGINRISAANQDSKEDNLGYLSYGRNRWCYLDIVLLGDPEIEFKTGANNGNITFNADTYGLSDTVTITVSDADLNTDVNQAETVDVFLSSTTESGGETITLTESNLNSQYFTAGVALITGAAAADGKIQIAADDQLEGLYIDQLTNSGDPVSVKVYAQIDGTPPALDSNSKREYSRNCVITAMTDEAATAKIYYGTTVALGQSSSVSTSGTTHVLDLWPLTPQTQYYYDIELTDGYGNSTIWDNAGAHYTFSTSETAVILLVDDDDGADDSEEFDLALSVSSLPFDLWDVDLRGSAPDENDMGIYDVVLWNAGLGVDADISVAEETSIASYLDADGSILINGMYLLYKSLTANMWDNYLYLDLATFEVVVMDLVGEDDDPVTDGMTLGLSNYYGSTSLLPKSGAAGIFSSGLVSTDYPYMGVRYPESGLGGFRMIFLGTPFEYVNSGTDPNNQASLLLNSVVWLSKRSVTDVSPDYGISENACTVTITTETMPVAPNYVTVGGEVCDIESFDTSSVTVVVPGTLSEGLHDIYIKMSSGAPSALNDGFQVISSTGDEDNDGLSNSDEIANGTDPFDDDSDGDSIKDGDEVYLGLDPGDSASIPYSYAIPVRGWSRSSVVAANISDSSCVGVIEVYDANGTRKKSHQFALDSKEVLNSYDSIGNIYSSSSNGLVRVLSSRNISVRNQRWSTSSAWGFNVKEASRGAGTAFDFPMAGWSYGWFNVGNPSSTDASVTAKIYDKNGVLKRTETFTVPGMGMRSSLEIFSGYIYSIANPASVKISSDNPVVLDHGCWSSSSGWGFSTLPKSVSAGTSFALPIWGWSKSWLIISNTEDTTAAVTVKVYDKNGELKTTLSSTAPANGTLRTWELIGNLYQFGSPLLVTVESDKNIIVENGRWSSSSGWGFHVPRTSTASGKDFRFPVTGLTSNASYIGNTSTDTASVTINVYDASGTLSDSCSVDIAPHGVANTWSELGNLYSISDPAMIEIVSDKNIVVDNGSWSSSDNYSGWGMIVMPSYEDKDNDGLSDEWEIENFGSIGLYDADDDPDTDSLTNEDEYANGTDPLDSDSDNDGLDDGEEVYPSSGTSSDPNSSDTDEDGLTDLEERNETTNPRDDDSDDDGISDGDEINIHGSDPLDSDSDNDSVSDGDEVQLSTDPSSSLSRPYIYGAPVKGWSYSFTTYTNVSDTPCSGLIRVHDRDGVLKKSESFTLDPKETGRSWSSVGNIYWYSKTAFVKILSTQKLYVDNGRWSGYAGWGFDVPEIGTAAGTEFVFPVSGWGYSWINVGNPGASDADITLDIYDKNGSLQTSVNTTVPSCGVVSSWDLVGGSVYYIASQAVVRLSSNEAVVVEHGSWSSGGGWGMTHLPKSKAAGKSFAFPAWGWNSAWMCIANTENTAANVTMKIYDMDGVEQSSIASSIPAGGFVRSWDLIGNIYSLANPASITIESDKDIAVNQGRWGSKVGWGFEVPGKDVSSGKLFRYTATGWRYSSSGIMNTSASTTANITIKVYDESGTLKKTGNAAIAPLGTDTTWSAVGNFYSHASPATVEIVSDQDITVDNGRWSSSSGKYSGWGFTILPLQ
jgi:peptidase C25-like protein/thrombospondin type 3 repeat protein